jgi:hypothetical protein
MIRIFGGQMTVVAPVNPEAPQSEFLPLTPQQQVRFAANLRGRVTAAVQAMHVNPAEQLRLAPLIAAIGRTDFYLVAAKLDPTNADGWVRMSRAQNSFAHDERHESARTRAYSEAMRLTLHASLILHLADPASTKGRDLLDYFIALHNTAFRVNGGWFTNMKISIHGAATIANEALRNGMGLRWLFEVGKQNHDAYTEQAGNMVRHARFDAFYQ